MSNGNYDVAYGQITNWKWRVEGNKIKCQTEILSKDRLYAGLPINSSIEVNTTKEKNDDIANGVPVILNGLSDTIQNTLCLFKNINSNTNLSDNITIDQAIEICGDDVSGQSFRNIIRYIQNKHKKTWKDYVYGIYYGRKDTRKPQLTSTSQLTTSNILGSAVLNGAQPTSKNNNEYDFDTNGSDELWLNLGLVIEALNYSVSTLAVRGNKELFRIDVDSEIIGGHPNLISSNGGICLIPNAIAPKYSYGNYGYPKVKYTQSDRDKIINDYEWDLRELKDRLQKKYGLSKNLTIRREVSVGSNMREVQETPANSDIILSYEYDLNEGEQKLSEKRDKKLNELTANKSQTFTDVERFEQLKNTTVPPIPINMVDTFDIAKKNNLLADFRLRQIFLSRRDSGVIRDDLDDIINSLRYEKSIDTAAWSYEFPSVGDIHNPNGSKPYPGKYSGYLKNIYVNHKHLISLIKNSSIRTYTQLIETLMSDISNSCGNFWDFRIVGGTGYDTLSPTDIATMRIVDYNFPYTPNQGSLYEFDPFDADGILKECGFEPIQTNAAAIRSLFAGPSSSDKSVKLNTLDNELLTYQYKDLINTPKNTNAEPKVDISQASGYTSIMGQLQSYTPPKDTDMNVYQVTTYNSKNEPIIHRLCLPSSEIVSLIVNDSDVEHNPKYIGVMPGISTTLTLQGIGGLRTFMMFLIKNFPRPYSEKNIIFRITEVQDVVEGGQWTTTITAGILPFRDSIRKRFNLAENNS